MHDTGAAQFIGKRPVAVDLAIEDESVAGRPVDPGRTPPARSMIASRVWPNAIRSSTKVPLPSGPQCTSARVIKARTASASRPVW